MLSATRLLGCAGFVVGLAIFGVLPGSQVGAQTSVLEVTSDTPEYCLRLLDRLSERVHLAPTPPPSEVTDLSTEGQRMCDQGQTRAGILRLRRAWLLMTRREAPASGAH
jgi:hypothetical protein